MAKEAKFRQFLTSNNILVLAGKTAKNNEELINQVEKGNLVLHTDKPGSPFCEIKNSSGVLDAQKSKRTGRISDIKGKPEKEDIEQAAVFCAKYSQDWRDNKKDVKVHIFLGKDISKKPGMKTGTFSVSKFKEIVVKKEEIKEFEEELKEIKDEMNKK